MIKKKKLTVFYEEQVVPVQSSIATFAQVNAGVVGVVDEAPLSPERYKLLYDSANDRVNAENGRTERLEQKAQHYLIILGALASLVGILFTKVVFSSTTDAPVGFVVFTTSILVAFVAMIATLAYCLSVLKTNEKPVLPHDSETINFFSNSDLDYIRLTLSEIMIEIVSKVAKVNISKADNLDKAYISLWGVIIATIGVVLGYILIVLQF